MSQQNSETASIRKDKEKISQEEDFFSNLQEKEKKHGEKIRGGGHGWTTFVEILMGDW